MTDVAITGKFYYQGSFRELTIGVTNGIITDIKKNLKAQVHHTVEGGIFPASTDTHVHFRDPGETQKEDFTTGSMAAVYGGTTTVLDMPNNRVPITNYDAFADKRDSIRGRSYCDYGLYSLFTGDNADIISDESAGIKIFLGGSTNSTGIGEMKPRELKKLAERNYRIVFHAESEQCLKRHSREVLTLEDHDLSRPVECEEEAINTVSEIKYPYRTVTHVSSASSLSRLSDRSVTTEVTPHHLLLNERMELGAKGKVNPPLRSGSIQQELLQNYVDGKIDVVSSDHAPHTEADKDEVQFAKSGIIGVETRVPVLLALVKKGILPMNVFIETAIEKPPSGFGIRKGKIEVGYLADFFSVNLSDVSRINEERLHSKNTYSPFDGYDAVFPKEVFIRGSPVLEGGEIISDRQGMHLNDIRGARNA